MNIYLAGRISGNLSKDWKTSIGGGQNENLFSGRASREEWQIRNRGGHLILESYYYARNNQWIEALLPNLAGFILDSGAFTFMQGSHSGPIDWDEYVEGYADFINRNNIELFFELDIDSVVGLKEVERLRDKLERLTGRQSIPVWHKNRGLDYFKAMCKDWPYVALGGFAKAGDMASRKKYEQAFPCFIDIAHTAGAKIHGLGYTNIKGLHYNHFDSVDSTAWLYGNRGGYLYKFNEITGLMEEYKAEGCRLKSHQAALHNYIEWQKLQRYAERYL